MAGMSQSHCHSGRSVPGSTSPCPAGQACSHAMQKVQVLSLPPSQHACWRGDVVVVQCGGGRQAGSSVGSFWHNGRRRKGRGKAKPWQPSLPGTQSKKQSRWNYPHSIQEKSACPSFLKSPHDTVCREGKKKTHIPMPCH